MPCLATGSAGRLGWPVGRLLIAAVLVACSYTLLASTLNAQERRLVRSSRPVLVAVTFEGNASLGDDLISQRIRSSPTELSTIDHLYRSARDADLDRMARHFYRAGGQGDGVRFLNTAIIDEDKEAIRVLYRDFGFHDAKVAAAYSFDTLRNLAALRFLVDEGPQYRLLPVNVIGLDDVPLLLREELLDFSLLRTGSPMTVPNIVLENDRILGILKNNGYPFAHAPRVPKVGPCMTCTPPSDSVELYVTPGIRYRVDTTLYSAVSPEGNERVERAVLDAQRVYRHGDYYDREVIDDTRRRLYQLGMFTELSFDTVYVRPEEGLLGLRVRYVTRDPNETELSGEVSVAPRVDETSISAGFAARYRRLNIFHRGIALAIGGRISGNPISGEESQWSLDGRLDFPAPITLFGAEQTSLLGGFSRGIADRVGTVDLVTEQVAAAAEFAWRPQTHAFFTDISSRIRYANSSYEGIDEYIRAQASREASAATLGETCSVDSVEAELVTALARSVYRIQVLQGDAPDLRESDDARTNASELEATYSVGVTGLADYRDDFFSPTDGEYLELNLDVGATGGPGFGAIGGFVRFEFDGRIYRPAFRPGDVAAAKVRVGSIGQFGDFPLTPLGSRFHAGGANSIRGWGSRDMLVTSPSQTITHECSADVLTGVIADSRRLLGGLLLVELSGEYRFRVSESLVAIGFLDVGNAYFRNYSDDRDLVSFATIVENLGVALGLNLGFITPAGPIRFGVGFPVVNPIDDGRIAYQLSIGHAF